MLLQPKWRLESAEVGWLYGIQKFQEVRCLRLIAPRTTPHLQDTSRGTSGLGEHLLHLSTRLTDFGMLACCQSFLQVRTCPKWSPDASTRRWTHEEKVWGQCNRFMLASLGRKKNSRLANLLGHITYTTITARQVYQILPHYTWTSNVYFFTLSCFFCIDHPTQGRLGSSAVTSQEHPKATKPHGSAKLQTRTDWRVQYLFDTYVFEVNTPTWNRRQTRQLCNRHQTSPSKNCKYQWATVVIASGRYLWLAISRRKLMED